MNHELFKTTKNNKVTMWFQGSNNCTNCGKIFDRYTAYYICDWNPKKSSRQVLCHDCVSQRKIAPLTYSQDRFMVYVVDDLPPGAVPVFPHPPNLTPVRGDVTVFEPNKIKSDYTIDNTKYSSFFGDGENHGFIVGNPDMVLIEDLDDDINDVDNVIKKIKG